MLEVDVILSHVAQQKIALVELLVLVMFIIVRMK